VPEPIRRAKSDPRDIELPSTGPIDPRLRPYRKGSAHPVRNLTTLMKAGQRNIQKAARRSR